MFAHLTFMAAESVVTFAFMLALIRWIGETQISQVTHFNWVAGACMGNIAANMLSANSWSAVLTSAIELALFSALTVLAAWIALKSSAFRSLTSGVPILLVHQGKFVFDHLRRGKVNEDLLKQMLREQGYFDYQNVETAILEPTGALSVLPKSTSHQTNQTDSPDTGQAAKARKESPHIK